MTNVLDFYNKPLDRDYWTDVVGLCMTPWVVKPGSANPESGNNGWDHNSMTAAQMYTVLTELDYADTLNEDPWESHGCAAAEELGLPTPEDDYEYTDAEEELMNAKVAEYCDAFNRDQQDDDLRAFKSHFAAELALIRLATDDDVEEDNGLDTGEFCACFINDYYSTYDTGWTLADDLLRFARSVSDEQLASPLYNGNGSVSDRTIITDMDLNMEGDLVVEFSVPRARVADFKSEYALACLEPHNCEDDSAYQQFTIIVEADDRDELVAKYGEPQSLVAEAA